MRIAVTGANSFIGKRLVKSAADYGFDVVAIVRRGSDSVLELKQIASNVFELNMDEYKSIGDVVGTVDCFVTLAWNGTRGVSRQNEKIQADNYKYTIESVKSIIDHGCKRIVTAGSQAEYGPCDGIITEDFPCNPNTKYGKYKLKTYESICEMCLNNNLSYKEPRFFSIYGPGDYENTLIMSCIRKMKNNETCELTECTQMWDYMYIDDAVDVFLKLCYMNCPDGVYNLASGDSRVLKDYVLEMKSVLHSHSLLNFGAIKYPNSGIVSINPSIAKIKKELGYEQCMSFKSGIKHISAHCIIN